MANRTDIFRRWIWLAVLAICLPVGACNCNNNASDAAAKDTNQAPTAEGATTTGEKAEAVAEEYPDDLYQDFNFGQFSQEERGKFVRVAKAELCPCPSAKASMHECLKKRATRCPVAEKAAGLMGSMVKGGYNETDILDKVAELIEVSGKAWEFELENRPFKGKPGAPVQIVEFADFQCPHCKEASKMMKTLHEQFPDDLVIYYKHYPLASHPFSKVASQAAVAAGRQGKFWQMHDLLFENQLALDADKVQAFGRRIGLNMQKFEADMKDPAVAAIVAQDRAEGDRTGLTGTPTIFINGKQYLGALSEAALAEAVKTAAAEAKAGE